MRLALSVVAASLCVAAAAATPAAAAPARVEAPRIGRCFQGGCAWFRIVGRQIVRQAGGERLIRVTEAEGGSEHRNDRYPSSARGVRIRWSAPSIVYFLCSTRRPTAILETDGTWEATQLDFVNGPFGPTEFVSAEYVATCHPGEDMNRPGFAARRGYRNVGEVPGSYRLARPVDIFEHR